MNHKLRYITLLLLMQLINTLGIKAQIPSNDSAWVKQTALSDGFNGSYLDTVNKWSSIPNNVPGRSIEASFRSNVSFTGTSLKIKLDTLSPNVTYTVNGTPTTFSYQSASFASTWPASYKFGYIEISAKYPTGYETYWPAFWLWSNNCTYTTSAWYNEVDICENGGAESYSATVMGTNLHLGYLDSCSNNTDSHITVTGLPNLSSAFHKYALMWDKNYMTWYFDDVPVRSIYDPTGNSLTQNSMYAIFDFALDYFFVNPHGYNSHLPAYFEVDYMNYYKLNTACTSTLTICNPNNDYNMGVNKRAVYKSINTGGTSCTPTFNTSNQYTLRATDYVLLDDGTTINDDGSGQFSVIISPCPN